MFDSLSFDSISSFYQNAKPLVPKVTVAGLGIILFIKTLQRRIG